MAAFALKIKTKLGQEIIRNLTPDSTIRELKTLLSTISNIPTNRLLVLSGFPPKTLDLSGETTSLSANGIMSGDTLILEEKPSGSSGPSTPSITSLKTSASNKEHKTIALNEEFALQYESDTPGLLMKYIVPADNSCLFTSIQYVLNGKYDESGTVAPWMRRLIAETVERESENYSEAILGKPNAEYCKWILDDKSWGGAIELAILSNYYGMEIAVVDTINAIINRFGEDQNYPHRVFLLFDGIHYDPLYLDPYDGGPKRTIFPTSDERLLHEAEILAKEAKSSRQFTDVEAQQHAQSTGHTNFGEVL